MPSSANIEIFASCVTSCDIKKAFSVRPLAAATARLSGNCAMTIPTQVKAYGSGVSRAVANCGMFSGTNILRASAVARAVANCGMFAGNNVLQALPMARSVANCDLRFASTGGDGFLSLPSSRLRSQCILSGATVKLLATPSYRLKGKANVVSSTVKLLAAPSCRLKGRPNVVSTIVNLLAAASSRANSVISIKGTAAMEEEDDVIPRAGIPVSAVIADILMMWSLPEVDGAPEFALNRAFSDLNSAIQTIWNQSEDADYFTNTTLKVSFDSGQSVKALPISIQNVTGPCQLSASKRPLSPVATLAELELFQSLYLEGDETDEPVAYHIDRSRQSGADPVNCRLAITPAPAEPVDILLRVVKEAPSYTIDDLGSKLEIPIPHSYIESLLMPITRYRASTFFLFADNDHKPGIDRDYQMAMASIGMADPNPAKQPEAVEVASK